MAAWPARSVILSPFSPSSRVKALRLASASRVVRRTVISSRSLSWPVSSAAQGAFKNEGLAAQHVYGAVHSIAVHREHGDMTCDLPGSTAAPTRRSKGIEPHHAGRNV